MFNLFRAKRRLVAPLTETIETKRTKKFPSFPLSNKRILDKVERITRLVETCFYALPFLATNRMEEEDFDCHDEWVSGNRVSLSSPSFFLA